MYNTKSEVLIAIRNNPGQGASFVTRHIGLGSKSTAYMHLEDLVNKYYLAKRKGKYYPIPIDTRSVIITEIKQVEKTYRDLCVNAFLFNRLFNTLNEFQDNI